MPSSADPARKPGVNASARPRPGGSRGRSAQGAGAPASLRTLVKRYDPSAFDARRDTTRIRLDVSGSGGWDAVIRDGKATLQRPSSARPDAVLSADAEVWSRMAQDMGKAMAAYRSGRLSVRRNMHAGVGFLAATSGRDEPGRLRFRSIFTRTHRLSVVEAGTGPAVIAVHGLGE